MCAQCRVAHDRKIAILVAAVTAVASLIAAPADTAHAARGDCSQPVSTGTMPVATDCLFILQVAVGSASCVPECICAPKGHLPTTATDATICLRKSVGQQVALNCPCNASTTSTISTSTTTTTVTATTTTMPILCAASGVPTCDGFCPEGYVCGETGGVACTCAPIDCGVLSPAPQCSGVCVFDLPCVNRDGGCFRGIAVF